VQQPFAARKQRHGPLHTTTITTTTTSRRSGRWNCQQTHHSDAKQQPGLLSASALFAALCHCYFTRGRRPTRDHKATAAVNDGKQLFPSKIKELGKRTQLFADGAAQG
jgi:hypothetical protein